MERLRHWLKQRQHPDSLETAAAQTLDFIVGEKTIQSAALYYKDEMIKSHGSPPQDSDNQSIVYLDITNSKDYMLALQSVFPLTQIVIEWLQHSVGQIVNQEISEPAFYLTKRSIVDLHWIVTELHAIDYIRTDAPYCKIYQGQKEATKTLRLSIKDIKRHFQDGDLL